jgi:predicted DNA-binding WGR domain protein
MTYTPLPHRMTLFDPACNMARFYAHSLEPTLFGEVMLVRNRGRIGTRGQVLTQTFARADDAAEALRSLHRQKARKGHSALARQ